MNKLGTAVAAAVVVLTAAGCGGGGRPSADEISKAYQKGTDVSGQEFKLPKAQADCVAKALVDSDVSDEGLQAIADLDTKYKASKKDTAAIKAVSDDVAKCVTAK